MQPRPRQPDPERRHAELHGHGFERFDQPRIHARAGEGAVNVQNAATSLRFNGPIVGGQAGLTKTGSGTLTLAGADNYTGQTTVEAGTLALANAAARSNVLNVANGGVNIEAGQVVFDYSGAADDPKAAILANLKASYGAAGGPFAAGPMCSSTGRRRARRSAGSTTA